MKHLIFILAILATSCADSRFTPSLSDEIAGEWVRTDDTTRHLIFWDGYATTWIYNFSTIIAPHWYTTEETGDREITISEINKGTVLVWRFSDVGDTVTVVDITHTPVFYFNLKRK